MKHWAGCLTVCECDSLRAANVWWLSATLSALELLITVWLISQLYNTRKFAWFVKIYGNCVMLLVNYIVHLWILMQRPFIGFNTVKLHSVSTSKVPNYIKIAHWTISAVHAKQYLNTLKQVDFLENLFTLVSKSQNDALLR